MIRCRVPCFRNNAVGRSSRHIAAQALGSAAGGATHSPQPAALRFSGAQGGRSDSIWWARCRQCQHSGLWRRRRGAGCYPQAERHGLLGVAAAAHRRAEVSGLAERGLTRAKPPSCSLPAPAGACRRRLLLRPPRAPPPCRKEIESMMAIVVNGDACNTEDVEKAFTRIDGVDAVVSTIGGTTADPAADSQARRGQGRGAGAGK